MKATSPNSGYAVSYHSSKPFGYAQGFAYPQIVICNCGIYQQEA